jgi:hypothetical protein
VSWKTGERIFIEIWPILENHIQDKNELSRFTTEMIELFIKNDIDIDSLLGANDTLNKFLKKDYGIGVNNDCYTGHKNRNSLLRKVAIELANIYNMALGTEDDCVVLTGRLRDMNCEVFIRLYNYANREYSCSIELRLRTFEQDNFQYTSNSESKATIASHYDHEKKMYIKDAINFENILKIMKKAIVDHAVEKISWSAPQRAFYDYESEEKYHISLDKLKTLSI